MAPIPLPPDGSVPHRDDNDSELSPRERARERHRDRKRQTRMVVDNAGLRRVLPALQRRRRGDAAKPEDEQSRPG